MNFERSCKFYENSRCILEGSYCDLNCDRLFTDEDFNFYDRVDALTRWRMEEVERDLESQRRKLR